jgi:putative SOS response-associated peptidase YedK
VCGRFAVLEPVPDLALRFAFVPREPLPALPAVNIAPTQLALVVVPSETGQGRIGQGMRWGLVPHWAKDPAAGQRLINARAETVAERPAFRHAFASRRCLVPATGFYEWRRDPGRRTPFFFRSADGQPLALAGLHERWRSADGLELRTFTVVTTAANALVAAVHDRMPVLLEPPGQAAWLDPATPAASLRSLMRPLASDRMRGYAVTARVNSPRYAGEDATVPMEDLNAAD